MTRYDMVIGSVLFLAFALSDVPANVTIEAHGRGAAMPLDPSDAILLLKRYASDDLLSQDPALFHQCTIEKIKLMPGFI